VTARDIDVAAVIVTHESAPLLPACLDSLEGHAGELAVTVVVSDSGSSDDVAALCRERSVVFLPGPNRGFGAAVNRALTHDSVRHARYVLVLNPDVEISEGTLAELVALCDQRPECGVFAPRQLDQHGRLIRSIGREPSPGDYLEAWRTGWPVWVWDEPVYEREARCDWVMGSAMLIRPEVFDSVGGFDERFFMFSEEVDLCTRARRGGWEVAYMPQLTVTHRTADRPFDEHRERLISWSELIYMRKWYGRRDRARMRALLVARLARAFLRKRRRDGSGRKEWVRLVAALRFRPRRYGPRPGGRD
jgi:GT2 family glycosyltransferase